MKTFQTCCEAHGVPCYTNTWGCFLGLKWQERKTEYSHLPEVEVENAWNNKSGPLPPHTSYQYGLNRDKITVVLHHKFSICVAAFSYIIAEVLSVIK